jgi:hypothetical protein
VATPRVFVLASGATLTAPDGGGTGQVWQGLELVDAVDLNVGDSISVGRGFFLSEILEIDPEEE